MRFLPILICILLLAACVADKDIEIEQEVQNLQTPSQQSKFLEEINDLDQKYRLEENSILTKFGHDSPEHKEIWDVIRKTDLENLHKVEAYFKHYGHPSKQTHTIKACGTPWLVLHHQSRNKPREDNFPYIYEAFLRGDIDGGSLTFFLNRMYDFQYGERITYKGAFTEEFEIDTLSKALGLRTQMEAVRQRIETES